MDMEGKTEAGIEAGMGGEKGRLVSAVGEGSPSNPGVGREEVWERYSRMWGPAWVVGLGAGGERRRPRSGDGSIP